MLLLRLVAIAALSGVIAACSSLPEQERRLHLAGLGTLEESITRDGVWRCNSPGGDVLAGVLLGSFVHARRIPVEIRAGDWCASAAAIAALGSPSLFKSTQGNLVFHGPSRPFTPVEVTFIDTSLNAWGVPASTRDKLLALNVGEVWTPGADDIRLLSTKWHGRDMPR